MTREGGCAGEIEGGLVAGFVGRVGSSSELALGEFQNDRRERCFFRALVASCFTAFFFDRGAADAAGTTDDAAADGRDNDADADDDEDDDDNADDEDEDEDEDDEEEEACAAEDEEE